MEPSSTSLSRHLLIVFSLTPNKFANVSIAQQAASLRCLIN